MTAIPVITIDGPSGSGKGTIGQLLAKKLGWHFLDSGALYRVLALAAEQQGIAVDAEAMLVNLANHLEVKFQVEQAGTPPRILLSSSDVTQAIRAENCGNLASKIGVLAAVRTALLARQRAFLQLPGLVTDGRDMGSVVFPQAQLKLFLEADLNERALRRQQQLKDQGINVSLGKLYDELAQRDTRDKERVVAPLKPAPDAVIIDTTGLQIDEVLQKALSEVQRVFGISCSR